MISLVNSVVFFQSHGFLTACEKLLSCSVIACDRLNCSGLCNLYTLGELCLMKFINAFCAHTVLSSEQAQVLPQCLIPAASLGKGMRSPWAVQGWCTGAFAWQSTEKILCARKQKMCLVFWEVNESKRLRGREQNTEPGLGNQKWEITGNKKRDGGRSCSVRRGWKGTGCLSPLIYVIWEKLEICITAEHYYCDLIDVGVPYLLLWSLLCVTLVTEGLIQQEHLTQNRWLGLEIVN